jgi:sarcosine oxidase
VLDRRGDVVIGAGCMGHAFKMAPAIGEALADLAEGRRLGPDFERFRVDRPSLTGDLGRSDRLAVEV